MNKPIAEMTDVELALAVDDAMTDMAEASSFNDDESSKRFADYAQALTDEIGRRRSSQPEPCDCGGVDLGRGGEAEMKHSPAPWSVKKDAYGVIEIVDADKDPVVQCFKVGKKNHEANAAFIVAACDSHQGFIDVLNGGAGAQPNAMDSNLDYLATLIESGAIQDQLKIFPHILRGYAEQIRSALAGTSPSQPDAQQKELIEAATLALAYFGDCAYGLESCSNCGSKSLPMKLRNALSPFKGGAK